MTEASWSNDGGSTIEWTMSASLEDVTRGGEQVPEVTSLQNAVRAWRELPAAQQAEAVLTSERPVTLPGELPADRYVGEAIGRIADQLPGNDTGAER